MNRREVDVGSVIRSPKTRWLVHAVLLAILLLTPEWSPNNNFTNLLLTAEIYAIVAYGLAFLYGNAGLFSVAHGGLWGIGAYMAALLYLHAGLHFWVALPLVALAGFAVSWIIGYPAMRVSGHYFLIITFALGELILLVIMNWQDFTNGNSGLPFLYTIDPVGPLRFTSTAALFRLVTVFLSLAVAAYVLLRRSRFGRRLAASRDHQNLALSVGINGPLRKVTAFAISGVFAAVSGQLLVYYQTAATPESFSPWASVLFIAAVIVGGTVRWPGPLIGILVFVMLPQYFGLSPVANELIYGGSLIAFILLMPSGIVGADEWWRRKRSSQKSRADDCSYPADSLLRVTSTKDVQPPTIACANHSSLLLMEAVYKRFRGLAVLQGVDLDVRSGEIRGLIGPNGAGKTTLFNIATGFLRADSGRIKFGNRAIVGRPYVLARRGLVRTFQQGDVFASMTPMEALEAALYRSRDSLRPNLSVHAILDIVGITDIATQPSASLPFGQRRLVGLAIALAAQPRLLLLDEPGAGLNQQETESLGQLLRKVRDLGITLCVVDHDMSLIMGFCERVAVLDAGKIIADGSPDQIVNDDRVVDVYLGAGSRA